MSSENDWSMGSCNPKHFDYFKLESVIDNNTADVTFKNILKIKIVDKKKSFQVVVSTRKECLTI